ncbi:tyrosine-type recombinase/integrase [Streptomyces sp. SP18ES09]|uniref:tyrosine-type recombinase/integrase n=1 Tax=Streptomyces sp. SP18ES09 TaxID=3002532 RepID=UPI002E7879F2|nr:tyrosine-type recombinase/integrase [Streptomyces sp. SP18ES09]MEE1819356.1 tyrosine-type recombinase/integrase [Streptomyces sp. SP18ES09]
MAFSEKRGKGRDGRMRYRGRYKLPNGRWGSVSRDDQGNPFYTARSAEQYAAGLETDVRRKAFINPRDGRMTVEEWATHWLASIDVGPLSDKEYRLRIKNQILPEWGLVALGDLSPTGIAAWEKRVRLKLSKNYADGVMSVFRTMLDDAVAERLLAANPVAARKSGRRGRYMPKATEEKVTATPRQVLLIARNGLALRGLNEYAIVLASAYTGLRIGELAGVHRDQVEVTDSGRGARLHSVQQSQYVGGVFTEIGNKYDSGRGLILPPFLAELLGELMASRPESEWVFTAPKGGRLLRSGDWYSTTWRPMVAGRAPRGVVRGAKERLGARPVLGVEGLTPHGLRHSQKVWLDEGNHPRVAVEARLGHVLPGVEGTYSHVTLKMELAIAGYLQELWEESLRPVLDRREFGPYPLYAPETRKRSPKNLPAAVLSP